MTADPPGYTEAIDPFCLEVTVVAANLVEFAQELKRAIPIDQVVGEYVPSLKRAGRTQKGLCPFHEEKTPSFTVNTEHGFYHCFGCSAHGDSIKFIQEFEKVDFRMAVETLARRHGIVVPEFEHSISPELRDEKQKQREVLLKVSRLASEYFVEQLWSIVGKNALEYLHERGLTHEQIRHYKLGYAPGEFEALLAHLRKHGFEAPRVAEAGLALSRDSGGFYDRFRDRIIFPISDQRGDVIAFGGRLLGGEGPKYLNSPETPLFHKGQMLYGWKDAREAIRDAEQVTLLEGYMDWIALHSQGVENVLAGLGTAFTPEQAKLLSRITKKAVLHYDGDEAGRKAAFRSAEQLLAVNMEVRVAALPVGDDPDTFIRTHGPAVAREKLEGAPGAIDFFLTDALDRFPAASPEGKQKSVEFMAPLLRAIKEPVLHEGYVKHVATRLGIEAGTLERSLAGKRRYEPQAPVEEEYPEDELGLESQLSGVHVREFRLLYLLAQNIERWDFFQSFAMEMFTHHGARRVFGLIYMRADAVQERVDEPPEDLFELCENEFDRSLIARVLNMDEYMPRGRSLSELSPEMIEAEIQEARVRLRERHSIQQRAGVRSRATAGNHDENLHVEENIHSIGTEVVREHEAYWRREKD